MWKRDDHEERFTDEQITYALRQVEAWNGAGVTRIDLEISCAVLKGHVANINMKVRLVGVYRVGEVEPHPSGQENRPLQQGGCFSLSR